MGVKLQTTNTHGLPGSPWRAKLYGRGMGRKDGEVDALGLGLSTQRPGSAGGELPCVQGVHSKNTVAKGGTLMTMEAARPWHATSSLDATANGNPTSLPP